jgi:hypothetical protein
MQPRKHMIHLLSLLGLALLLYGRVLPSYFLSDDFCLIGRVVRSGMFSTWGESTGGFLRPVTILSYLIDLFVWDLNPVGFHLTNVLVHGLNGFLVFLIVGRLFQLVKIECASLLAFLTGSLFIALSCHSESVSWISGRTDVLATSFGLGATLCLMTLNRKSSLTLIAGSLALLSISLLAKECAVVLPIVWTVLTLTYFFVSRQAPTLHSISALVGAFVCLIAYFFARKATLGHFIGGYGTEYHISLLRPIVLDNALDYSLRSFLPAPPLNFYSIFHNPAFLLFAIGIVACAVLLRRRCFRSEQGLLLCVMILCFYASLVPVLTMRIGIYDTMGERFLYMPSVFACASLILFIFILSGSRRLTLVLACLLIAAEATALQVINTRWITASYLAREIAREVATHDPKTTVILNIPDNYRGAYVFRNGLGEAATIFLGNCEAQGYRIMVHHDVNSLKASYMPQMRRNSLVFALPAGQRIHQVHDHGFTIRRGPNTVVVADLDQPPPEVNSLIIFCGGSKKPMLRTIDLESGN